MNQTRPASEKTKGAILAVVLVMLLSLSAYVVGSMNGATRGAMEISLLTHEYQASLAAEAALPIVGHLLDLDNVSGADTLLEPWAAEYTDATLTINIRPCNSYLNPNLLIRDTDDEYYEHVYTAISTLFLAEDITETGVINLTDWIDKNTSSKTSAAESFEYLMKRPVYLPRNEEMVRPEEMLLVHGLETLTPKYVRDHFTVWGYTSQKLNINFVPTDILLAYLPDLAPYASQIVQWRLSKGFEHISQLLSATGMDGDDEEYLEAINYLTVSSKIFQAMVQVNMPGCQLTRRYVVVRNQYGDNAEPNVLCRDDLSVKLVNTL